MDKKEEIKKDIRKFSAITAISNTEGGKILIESLKKDIISSIDEIINKYKNLPHIEMVAVCARLAERIILLRVLNGSKKLVKLAKEDLKFVLEEGGE